MTKFGDTLRELNQRLDLPQPVKSRILLEIAGDLEDLEQHFLDSGLPEREAHRQAIEHFDLSDEALEQLVDIHMTWFRRFLDRFSAQMQSRWERAIVFALLFFVVVATGPAMFSARVLDTAGAAVWPVVGVTFVALLISLQKFYSAYMKQDHDLRRLRSGLPAMLVLGAVNIALGLAGCALGLYMLARNATEHAKILPLLTAWLHSSSATLMVTFLSAIIIALLWFIITGKVTRIEQAEAALLLE